MSRDTSVTSPALPGQPLLVLAMIVRDEAASIGATLDSCFPHVDAAVLVVDEDDLDGTDAAAHAWADAHPGCHVRVGRARFRGFAASRNHALDLARLTGAAFALMLSGDETLEGGAALRDYLAGQRGRAGVGAHALRLWQPPYLLVHPRVTPCAAGAGWRYDPVLPAHEGCGGPGVLAGPVPDARVVHVRRRDGDVVPRLQADFEGLYARVRAAPEDARAWFYLGLTLRGLGRDHDAARAFARRIALGGWDEERFVAALRRGDCAADGGAPWARVAELYEDAVAMRGHVRAEPWARLALGHGARGAWAPALECARRAAALPLPERDVLFVEPAAYGERADALRARIGACAAAVAAGRPLGGSPGEVLLGLAPVSPDADPAAETPDRG